MEEELISAITQDAQSHLAYQPELSQESELRRFKTFWQKQRSTLKKHHREIPSGRELSRIYTHLVDTFLSHLFQNALTAYKATHKNWSHPISLVALGGYGRKELSPHSDIDLMFLYPQKIRPEVLQPFLELFNQKVLYILWDLKLKVGHSYRTIPQTLEEAQIDFRTLNAQLEARLICGSKKLFSLFHTNYQNFFFRESQDAFIQRCIDNQTSRRQKFSNTVFLQEPDIKSGVGGLRDYQTILWIAQARLNTQSLQDLKKLGYITAKELSQLELAHDFLLKVRNELHFESHRPTNLLYLDQQPQLAWNLGYFENDIFKRVEAFMKDYYRHAHNIYQISHYIERRLCQNQHKQSKLEWIKSFFIKHKPQPKKEIDGFILKDKIFHHKNDQVFIENPVRLIRIFRHCQQFQAKMSFELTCLIRESLDLITRQVSTNPAANKSFRAIWQHVGEVFPPLALMHELGVLSKFIPEFEPLTHLVQHEFYHRYTADIHTLKTIKELDKIFASTSQENEHYLKAIRSTSRPALLYPMLLLHDIGKARSIKDHSEIGVTIAQPILERMGLNPKEQEVVLFIIQNHLKMARFWQRFDVDEPESAISFSHFLGDVELLAYLYVLTYCDAKGTSTDLWNSYKEMLHSRLYLKTLEQFGSKRGILEERKLRKQASYRDMLKTQNPKLTDDQIEQIIKLHPQRYFVMSSPEEMQLHINMLDQLVDHINKSDCSGSLVPIIHWDDDLDLSMTIVTIVTWDRTGLFYNIAGAFAASGLSIISSKAITRKDKVTIDTFYVTEADLNDEEAKDYKKIFEEQLEKTLIDENDPMPTIVALAREQQNNIPWTQQQTHLAPYPTKINVFHENSLKRTIVEIQCNDQIGLLYRIGKTIADHGFDIKFARITTEHSVAIDTFHIIKNNQDEPTLTSELINLREDLNTTLSKNPGLVPH